jgi:hypothetical protein
VAEELVEVGHQLQGLRIGRGSPGKLGGSFGVFR